MITIYVFYVRYEFEQIFCYKLGKFYLKISKS